ncbi:hypothetical protein [Kineosporia babensis]|uniref:Uncharacterized protein n=1 Tax=Kineosporia babensis TaxID=499548 RepID=A0A9X1T2Q0_9ACTN|nr:hypothetical protein [Kineosporia babensis]MCD5314878.1 hypothetical protein [Kineosporia babensis]
MRASIGRGALAIGVGLASLVLVPLAPTPAAAEAVDAETVISAEDYDRAKAKAASTPDTSAERRIETQFIEDAAVDHGNTYTRAEVEGVDLGPAFSL